MSLVDPPDDPLSTNWYELWVVCVARLIGIAAPEQAPVTATLMYPSPQFKLPAAWDSKYLIGTSIALRIVDRLGQLIPNKQEADERRDKIRRERSQFAIKCGAVVPPGERYDEPYFECKNAFQQLIGLCGMHMPSCIILKTIPAKNAIQFKRLAVHVDQIAKTQELTVERDNYWKPFFKYDCISCIDGHCNPAGFAAASGMKTKLPSSNFPPAK